MVPIKLKPGNHLLWKNLFLHVLRKFRMLGLVTGSEPPPAQAILDSDGAFIVNPSFDLWYYCDQSLMIWLVSTLRYVP
ncbi:unnamed protein product [Prunus armeniaca]